MRAGRTAAPLCIFTCLGLAAGAALAADPVPGLPKVPEGWTIELVKQAPEIAYPTAVVCTRMGTVYLGQDPMDMPGPPTEPIDSVVRIDPKGKVTVFADKLWAVMGLEWEDDTLYVVHAPYLSAFRDRDNDGKADERVDLMTGLGPKLPGFSGINDHVASGVRLGMDGFLYISVGDKGIPHGVGKDGTVIRLFGGGVIRIRPDGTGLEVVSTGERNPVSVALTATDEVFTYGNDDDSKKWPNSLTHHIVGGHYGYPYQFLNAPTRALPIMAGELGGAGGQAMVYNEPGLPVEYQGNLFVCEWGLQTVFRYQVERSGATYKVTSKTPFVTKGGVPDFRPFSICPGGWDGCLYLVDWAYTGWLSSGPKTGRLYKLTHKDARPYPVPPLFEPIKMPNFANDMTPAMKKEFDRLVKIDMDKVAIELKADLEKMSRELKAELAERVRKGDKQGAAELRRELPKFENELKGVVTKFDGGMIGMDDDPAQDPLWIETLDHPSRACRLHAQRGLVRYSGARALKPLVDRLRKPEPPWGRLHAIWALDELDEPEGRAAIRSVMNDPFAPVRREAVRSAGVSRDQKALPGMLALLKDENPTVRREAAIALGRLGDKTAGPGLMAALGDSDPFAAWSIRHAVRALGAWDVDAITAALLDPKKGDNALKLCDEAWAVPVVEALTRALPKARPDARRAEVVATLAGLYRKYPVWSGDWFGTNPLAGSFPQKTERWNLAGMTRVQDGLTVALRDGSPAVRLRAIAGLIAVGRPAAETLRAALGTESDPQNLEAIVRGLGVLGDFGSAKALGAIVLDGARPETVRLAALDALGGLRGPQAFNARISVVYDPQAPSSLVSRALPPLGRDGLIPPNDLAGFLGHADPSIRASALRAISGKAKALPGDVRQAVLGKLDDADPAVRKAAVEAVAALGMRESVPKLIAAGRDDSTRSEATRALAAMPDLRALPVYLSALRDRDPEIRRAGESALLAIRDVARPDLETAARAGAFDGPAALAMERVLTAFRPVTGWRVIGPFSRTTPQVFAFEPVIDFALRHPGAGGKTIGWAARDADPETGRIVIDDFKAGRGDVGGFGYDTNGSPDLCAFGYAEVTSDDDREALLLVGSSGSILVTVNERVAVNYTNFAGRAYRADGDLVRVSLRKGANRLLVKSRQGVGSWSFAVQVSEPSTVVAGGPKSAADPEALRAFVTGHEGDPKKGEALFFDARGVGCVKCHAAAGKGTANFGPDLTGLALKYDKAEIVRSVLEPSSRIANGYQPAVIATRNGKVITGLVRSETGDEVEVVDSEARLTRIPKDEIEGRRAGGVSVMPAGLVDTLSVVEFADLVSYLQSLKAAPPPSVPPSDGR